MKLDSATPLLACLLLGLPALTLAKETAPVYVGVLESFRTSDHLPVSSHPHVRIAFQWENGEWKHMKDDFNTQESLATTSRYYPASVQWTVVFDGRRIGMITSRDPGRLKAYGDVGTQIITSKPADISKIRIGVSRFDYMGEAARTRPLLLVSSPNYIDPEHWKPTTLSAAEKARAIKEFRKQVPKLDQCDQPEQPPIRWISYPDRDIKFLSRFRSGRGELVYGMELKYVASTCQWFDDPVFYDYWYAMRPDGTLHLLGSQMNPIDAADLNGNGASEWVFQTARGEDDEGYKLFYNDFRKSVWFQWSYH